MPYTFVRQTGQNTAGTPAISAQATGIIFGKGNLLILAVATNSNSHASPATVQSVVDTVGNLWVFGGVQLAPSTSAASLEIWYCLRALAGTTQTVTVNVSATADICWTLAEFAPTAGEASFIDVVVTTATGNSVSPTTASVATISANEVVFGAFAYASATPEGAGPTNGFTGLNDENATGHGLSLAAARKIETTVQAAESTGWTIGSNLWATAIVSFQSSAVLSLVDLLSNGQADVNLFPLQYADVINTLGPMRWHTTTSTVNVTQGTPLITLPASLLNLITILYDGQALSMLEHRELEVLNSGWRNAVGNPIAYTLEDLPAQTAELYPAPHTTSPPTATAIYVENRTNVLPILTLPVALLVLQREFARESDHADYEFAAMCGTLGQLLLSMLTMPENSL